MEKLGVELIYARSPQAKGRIERLRGTFQDGLASEVRLAKAATLEEANQALARSRPATTALQRRPSGPRTGLDR